MHYDASADYRGGCWTDWGRVFGVHRDFQNRRDNFGPSAVLCAVKDTILRRFEVAMPKLLIFLCVLLLGFRTAAFPRVSSCYRVR